MKEQYEKKNDFRDPFRLDEREHIFNVYDNDDDNDDDGAQWANRIKRVHEE